MPDIILEGNTSTTVQSPVQTIDYMLQALIIVNKSGGTLTVNVQIVNINNVGPNINPQNMQLASGTNYEAGGYMIQAGSMILVTVNGSCDYYIDLTPVTN